jgi:hypothetical protein
MSCCKIGCSGKPVQQQAIVFRNKNDIKVRTVIEWCDKHSPKDAVCDYEDCNLELLRASKGDY